MSEEKIVDAVEEAMNTETFDVLAYLDGQPIATEKITIYVNVPKARRLHQLVDERKAVIAQRREDSKNGKGSSLSLVEDEEETQYDAEINELVTELEKTSMVFELQTVAPKLIKAIENKYKASEPKDNQKALEEHTRKSYADILSRAISRVTLGDGRVDNSEWTAERLIELEDRLYPQQAERLITALWDMINTGYVFDEALTVDF